ncbi:MAG: O-antigen ligase family protein [Patescibacteria group bacterium]
MKLNILTTPKSLEYGLYLLIFLLPWQTRWMIKPGELNGGYWEYNTYSLYAFDILLAVFLFFCFFVFFRSKFKIQNSKFKIQKVWWLVGVLEFFVFLSIFFAPDWKLALYGYGRFLLGVGLLFLLTQIKYDKIKLYWSLVAAGVIQSSLAMQQFLTQTVIGNKWLGMAAQTAGDLGVSVVEAGDERFLRAYGSLPHPNILGGFLAIVLLVNIILYFDLWRILWRKRHVDVSPANESAYQAGLLLSLIFFVINFTGLLLTFSRSAWLGFFVGFVVLLLHCSIVSRSKENVFNILKFIFIIAAIGSLFIWGLRAPILGRLNIDNRLENKSLTERANYNQEAWQIIKKHWLFGVGIKNYGLGVYNEIDNNKSAYAYQPAHNVFLLVWAETGIFGLFCFFAFLLFCFLTLWRRRDFQSMSLLIATVVIMLFDHWIWSLGFGILLFWLVTGIVYGCCHSRESGNPNNFEMFPLSRDPRLRGDDINVV